MEESNYELRGLFLKLSFLAPFITKRQNENFFQPHGLPYKCCSVVVFCPYLVTKIEFFCISSAPCVSYCDLIGGGGD